MTFDLLYIATAVWLFLGLALLFDFLLKKIGVDDDDDA